MINLIASKCEARGKNFSLMTQLSKMAQPYAKALFDIAHGAGILDSVHKKLRLLSSAFAEHPVLVKALAASFYSKAEQTSLIESMLRELGAANNADASYSVFANFLKLLVTNGKLATLADIAKAFEALMLDQQNLAKVELRSSIDPTIEQKQQIVTLLKTLFKKEILLDIKIDTSLLGGFIVKFGSYQIDTSLLTKLSSLKLALKEGN